MFLDELFKDPVGYLTVVAIVIGSIVLHELGHALVATWEGDPTPKIRGHLTWDPRVHMGWMSIILVAVAGIGWGLTPVNPSYFRHRRWGGVLVAFAGPAVNLLLALTAAGILVIATRSGVGSERVLELWLTVLSLNCLLFLFNMFPVPPLDGFSVLDGAVDLGDLGAWLRQLRQYGVILVILLINFNVVPIQTWSHRMTLSLLHLFGWTPA